MGRVSAWGLVGVFVLLPLLGIISILNGLGVVVTPQQATPPLTGRMATPGPVLVPYVPHPAATQAPETSQTPDLPAGEVVEEVTVGTSHRSQPTRTTPTAAPTKAPVPSSRPSRPSVTSAPPTPPLMALPTVALTACVVTDQPVQPTKLARLLASVCVDL